MRHSLHSSGRRSGVPPQAQGKPDATRDGMFIAGVVLLCAAGYVGRLGFYSDDWYHLSACARATGQPFFTQFGQLLEATPGRPVQAFLLLGLGRAFGVRPLGYHMVNGVVQAMVVALLYAVVRRLGLHRGMALGFALLFSLLPHYSTDRFWVAALQANWSMLFFLAAFYAGLRAFEVDARYPRAWVAASALCIALSLLSYEVTLGLFVLLPIAIAVRAQQWSRPFSRRMLGYILTAATVGTVILLLKLRRTPVYRGHFFHHLGPILVHAMRQLIEFNFVKYGLRLPWVAWNAAHHVPWPVFLLAAAVAGLVYWYLSDALRSTPQLHLNAGDGLTMIGLGCAVFLLGYGLFAANLTMDFTTTGVDNRLSIASSLGAAMVMLGAFEAVTALIRPEKMQRYFFCAVLALVCASNAVVINALATWWQVAYSREQVVLTDIHQHALPSGTSLFLDGVCPYVGPGIVFEAWWDVGPALQIVYADSTLRGDVVSPRMRVGKSELTTTIYESITASYPYNDNLWIYNFGTKQVYKIPDDAAAERYFGVIAPTRNSNCGGKVGQGVPIF
jgi:hypothetical protein